MNVAPTIVPASRGMALVVDDDEATRMFVEHAMVKLGFAVKTAADGMAALELCQNETFDFVICDMRMPKLSGISFLKNVRMRAPQSARRVIFLTSIDDSVTRRETLEAGAQDYLVKPVSAAKLAQTIDKHMH